MVRKCRNEEDEDVTEDPGNETSRDGHGDAEVAEGSVRGGDSVAAASSGPDSGGSSGSDDNGAGAPPRPAGAEAVFGDRVELAQRYAEWLADAGLVRGLMGPRERPRLWDRHILNCAAAASELEEGASVVDIGSGAGLPGIPLALARPDLRIILVEPLLRRATFLQEVAEDLGIDVRVVRGRAEDKAIRDEVGGADVVTSRAVAPLAKLAGWSAPLLREGGRMVALKGSSATEEVERDRGAVTRLGLSAPEVVTVSAPDAEETHLVIATRTAVLRGGGKKKSKKRR